MKAISYRAFSLRFHKKNWQNEKPNVCQFELTFGCGLHCKHCYSDCYNKAEYIKRELNTREAKFILDKVYDRGMLWLCFTGGDPLTREDFLELYAYAKDKGFIISIFTNPYSMDKRIAEYLRDRPPFAIEITLNAVSEDLYEQISQVKGSFAKVMQGINLILKANLPLKIKTQVTRDNFRELPQIKKFVKSLGLKFKPSVLLHSRLDGDLTPCNLRISPQEVLSLNGNKRMPIDNCGLLPQTANSSINSPSLWFEYPHHPSNHPELVEGEPSRAQSRDRTPKNDLFSCAIGGGDGIYIDPYGNIVPCSCIRKPKVNLLKKDIGGAQKKISNWIKTRHFSDNSKCRRCSIRNICYNCPGKALLETRNLEGMVNWFCDLAHLISSPH